MQTNSVWYDSPLGLLYLEATNTALLSLSFGEKASRDGSKSQRPTSSPQPPPNLQESNESKKKRSTLRPLTDSFLEEVCAQLDEYFAHRRRTFDLPLEPQGTPFQQRVWQQLQQIPFGETCSYLEFSKALGVPQAVRAVGAANGSNPLAIWIPCHRVISSKGELTGYGGGLWRKEWLLRHEGALLL